MFVVREKKSCSLTGTPTLTLNVASVKFHQLLVLFILLGKMTNGAIGVKSAPSCLIYSQRSV